MLFVVAVLGVSPGATPGQRPERRPNVILIVTDDMGYADVGFNGSRDIKTPNIDHLARAGVRFTDAYVTAPICSPSRAGFLTGRYQQRFGHERNPAASDEPHVGLPVDQVTIAQMLKDAGYATGGVGKWHMGRAPHFHPNRRGFDEWFGFLGGGHRFLDWEVGKGEYLSPILRDRRPVEVKKYLTDAFSDEAVAFVERHRARPFFLYLAYNAPHVPLQATDAYLRRVAHVADARRRTYAAMLTAVDDGVGRISAKLRDLGLEQDTLIFFFSDNGGPLRVSANGSDNGPLREGKGTLYEGGVRVPMAVKWTGTLPAGAEYNQPVNALDILPTAAAAAGAVGAPAKLRAEGVDLLPHLRGKTKKAPHDALFWRVNNGQAYALRRGRYKLIKRGTEPPELYDLQTDGGETTDIAGRNPKLIGELQAAYEAWDARNIAPIFPGLNQSKEP